jgi:CBS domain containing-hemolysin-like protein
METLEDGSSSVSGLLSLREFEEQFGVEFKDPEYETIGGYVFGQIGSSPTMGDKVDIFPYQLKVTELNELRIARLAVVKMSDSVIENKTVQERVNH